MERVLQPDIAILFTGESGSGKSTCINYFANYFTNSSFDENNKFNGMKILIPNALFPTANYYAGNIGHRENNVHDNTISQTQDCTAYEFKWEGKRVQVIDTPGFNDTDSSKDDENIRKILKQVAKVPFITAILITINGTNVRLSTSVKATLEQLRGSLPDEVFKNLFFIFTNCIEETRNFNQRLIADFNPATQRIFHMQNSLFSIKDKSILNNPKSVKRLAQTWEESFETMGQIMNEIDRTSAASTRMFEEMRIRREQLIIHKENLIEKQKSLLIIMKELQIEKDRLNNAEKDQAENKNFTQSKTISVIEIEKKEYYSTICLQHGKVQVCHERCSLTYEPQLNFAHFQRCLAADGNNCKHCRCGMNEHLHSYEIPVSRSKTIQEIIQSKKAAYNRATSDVNNINDQIGNLTIAVKQCQKEVNDIKDSLIRTIRELKGICSHFNFHEEMNGTIQRLRKEARIATNFQEKQEFNATADAIQQCISQL